MADELKARLSVDTSAFKTGMTEAAVSTRSLKDVSVELKGALANLSDAELKLGQAAAQGNAQAAAVIEEYKGKVAELTAELAQAEQATQGLAVATRADVEATDESTAALQQNISARMAATAEIRLAEGGIQGLNRAAAAYLTTLPGVAAAAQAAFAVAGPIAVIAVLGQLIHAIDGVIEDYKSLSSAARQAAIDQATAAAHGIATVKPNPGIGERVARFVKSFTSNADAPGAIQSAGGSDETVKTAAGVERENTAQTAVLRSQNELNEAGLKGSALAKQKQLDIQAEIDLRYKQSNALSDVIYANEQLIKDQNSTQDQVKFAQQQIEGATKARTEINTEIQVLGNHKQAEAKVQAADATKDDEKAAREQMQQLERQFADMGKVAPEEALRFWQQAADLFRDNTAAATEYTHAQEQVNKYTEELEKGLSKQSEAIKKFEEEEKKLADLKPPKIDTKWATEINEDLTKSGDRWREFAAAQTKAVEIDAQNTAALAKQRIAIEEADGALRPLAAAQRLAAIDAEEYRRKLEALNEELTRLKKEGQDLQPGSPGYSKNQTQQVQVQNQILSVTGQAQVSGAKDQEAIAQQMAAPYQKAATDIENAFTSAFTQVAMRQKSWSQAMAGVLVNLELEAAQSVEKWVVKQTQAEILTLAKHVLTNQQKTASDTSTATIQATAITAQTSAVTAAQATQTAAVTAAQAAQTAAVTTSTATDRVITTTFNVAEILSYAAVAAAAAAAAAAVGGPVAMAAAASAAYSEVSAFAPLASFDVGATYVPKTGIAMIHKNEQIVTESNNRELMNFVRSAPHGPSSNVRATINNHYNNPGQPPSARQQAGALHNLIKRGHARA